VAVCGRWMSSVGQARTSGSSKASLACAASVPASG
jgi:hypothetical protein